MDWIEIIIHSGLIGSLGWYLKHKIDTSSKLQINSVKAAEKANHSRMLEELKAELGWTSEVKKIRFSSIYERRVNALLDVYAAVQKYEMSIGEVSRNVIYKNGEAFENCFESYCEKRQALTETFWCNAALFEQNLISEFSEYRTMIRTYDETYERILREPEESRSYSELPELEFEQGAFSRALKRKVKAALADS